MDGADRLVHIASMLRRVGMLAIALGLVLGAGMPVASATEPVHVAGLIVDYGGGEMTYAWVPFTEDEISGVDLLEKSGLPVLSVGFGGIGDAVCKIVRTGCDVSACRLRLCQTADHSSPFWQYLRLGPDGVWAKQPLGGSSSKVTDGAIDAWVWAGSDSMPQLPVLSLTSLAGRAGVESSASTLPGGSLRPFMRTIGGRGESASGAPSSRLEYLLAGVLLIAISGAGGVVAWRSRQHRGQRPL